MNFNLTKIQTKQLLIVLLCLAVAVFFLVDAQQWLNLHSLKQNRETLLNYVDQHYVFVYLICGLLYITITTLSLPGGIILSLALGLLFGRWMGSLLIVFSATVGATFVFLLARYLIADWVRERLQGNEQAVQLMNTFQTDAFNYLLFLRLTPVFPFWLVNLAPAFTPITLRTYIITTFVGIIPGSFVFANLGQSVGQIENAEQLLSIPVLISLSLLGILALVPVILKRYKNLQPNESNE